MPVLQDLTIKVDYSLVKDIVKQILIEDFKSAKDADENVSYFSDGLFANESKHPFIVHNGQVYINNAYVASTKQSYPVQEMAADGEWVIYKDGSVSITDPDFTYSGFIKY